MAKDPPGEEPPATSEPLITLDTQNEMLEEAFRIYSEAAGHQAPVASDLRLLHLLAIDGLMRQAWPRSTHGALGEVIMKFAETPCKHPGNALSANPEIPEWFR